MEFKKVFLLFITDSLAGAESVDASEPVELESESVSGGAGNVSFIHFRYSITSSVILIILPNIL